MRVLIVNHTSTVSGAERAVLELVASLPEDVEAAVACPPGELAERLAAEGREHVPIAGTAGSLRLDGRLAARAAGELLAMTRDVRREARRRRVDVVHANSVRAGLACVAARRVGAPPVVAQVHDCLPDTRVTRAVRAVLRRADVLVANSDYTARRFGAEMRVTHSPVDLDRFAPERVDRDAVRKGLGVAAGTPLLAIVGQITPWKGQDTAVRALAGVRRSHPDARLLVVGATKFVDAATRYDNRAYLAELRELVTRLGLGDAVALLGDREDVPEILAAADLALVPSWEEPFGRAVVEALAMGTPVLATEVGGPAEVIEHGREGLLLPPRDPDAWACAAASLLRDAELRGRMGEHGRRTARRFERGAHARAMTQAYREAMR